MFKSIIQWHSDWENEILVVLADPARIDTVTPGYRQRTAQHLVKLSVIERQQLHGFSLRYFGSKGYWALGKLVLALSAMGLGW